MIQKIVTLGPATGSKQMLERIKEKNIDFVRINMSHSTLKDLEYYINLAKEVGLDFIIDTEGSQVRTCEIEEGRLFFEENQELLIVDETIVGNKERISLRPKEVFAQLEVDDILYIDFDTLVLAITDVSERANGIIRAKVVSRGELGSNKGVVIDTHSGREISLPPLTEKDYKAIELGKKYEIEHLAFSFARNAEAVRHAKEVSGMKIISKIECIDALKNLDEIIRESDYLLIDRGDLSKEIPIEKIPLAQQVILTKARQYGKKTFVATNLLETMIKQRKPTRAEVHDILETINEGADGLVLAAETAIGKYPIGCINMLNKLIDHSNFVNNKVYRKRNILDVQISSDYLIDHTVSSSLIPPNGGNLVNRIAEREYPVDSLLKIKLNENTQLDFEQIAVGAYSPLEGFLTKEELESVLENLRMPDGKIWPMPILLDISKESFGKIKIGDKIALEDATTDEIVGTLDVEDVYEYSPEVIAKKFYSVADKKHPGVALMSRLSGYFVGGKINLFKFSQKELNYYYTPRQTRRIFEEKNWSKVVGFHTRNVIHKAHEYIQFSALEKSKCDGIFLHPVVGKKKPGDYNAKFIVKSYEYMIENVFPKDTAFLGVFPTYSRYGGQKEALFTAICRQNYGCSHFVVGRDHTGTGSATANSGDIFKDFKDLGIEIVRFEEVYYSPEQKRYMESRNGEEVVEKLSISGTQARRILLSGEYPPEWFMRKEVAEIILSAIKKGEEVFVKE